MLKCRTCTNNAQKVVSDVVLVASVLLFFLGYFYLTGEDVQTFNQIQKKTPESSFLQVE